MSFSFHNQRMKSHHVGLLLLLVYSTTASRGNHFTNGYSNAYQKFKLQHFKEGMRISECDSVIRDRNIFDVATNLCKPTNTFINAPLSQFLALCRGNEAGRITTNNLFTFVMCQLTNGADQPRQPNCQYRGWSPTIAKRLIVDCNGGLPVHFVGYA